jgi:hypothetical protein
MSIKERLSKMSDFQQKFYKETAGITDKKVLQEKYLNEAPTAKGGENEAEQEKAFWKLIEERQSQGR